MVAIGIGGRKPSDIKDTGNNIRATGRFVVNLVAADLAEQMNITALTTNQNPEHLPQIYC